MTEGAILVTGAAGLLGNAVCRLLEAGGREVVGIDRRVRTDEGFEINECDLTDVHRLHSIVRGRHLGGTVHCGALSGPMVARDNPMAVVQANIVGTANVLELARTHGAARFVFCSSTSVYGEVSGCDIAEDAPLNPTTVYGASKAASEHLVRSFSAQYGLDGVCLRISWVYGPRRTTDCVLRTMISDAQAGRPSRLPYGLNFPRQFVHVDDVSRALVAALDHPRLHHGSYTVTGGSHLTLGEVADIVRSIFPDADITLADLADPFDDKQGRFDISSIDRDLGFKPEITLEQGIRSYAEWLRLRQLPS